jgi:hypothetical protein
VIDERNILQFAVEYFHKNDRARWNGRQIRNACLTALALAEHSHQEDSDGSEQDAEDYFVLGRDQFEQVGEANHEFFLHREAITGLDAEQWAQEKGLRAADKNVQALVDGENTGTPRGESMPDWEFSSPAVRPHHGQAQQRHGFPGSNPNYFAQGHEMHYGIPSYRPGMAPAPIPVASVFGAPYQPGPQPMQGGSWGQYLRPPVSPSQMTSHHQPLGAPETHSRSHLQQGDSTKDQDTVGGPSYPRA